MFDSVETMLQVTASLDERIKRRPDESKLSWRSHFNIFNQRGLFTWVLGRKFGEHHTIWQYLDVGDYIAVVGVAYTRYWECNGEGALLFIEEYFDPSAP